MEIAFKSNTERKDLKLIDDVIFSMVKSATEKSGGFTMKDDEIIVILKITKGTLHNCFNKLKALGMIYIYSKTAGVRTIKHVKTGVYNDRKTK